MQGLSTPVRKDFEITPGMINTEQHFWDAFGSVHIEKAARLVIEFCQRRNSWKPFSLEEYVAYLKENYSGKADTGTNESPEPISLSRLVCMKRDRTVWIINSDGRYHLTEEFIRKCHEASPQL